MRSLLAALTLLSLPQAVLGQSADPQYAFPLWELGLGAVGRVASDYPGADDYSTSASPIPYIRYRGKILELGGEDALRLNAVRGERFRLGFSLDSSKRVAGRVSALGNLLPDLDRLVEFGPELSYRLADQSALFAKTGSGRLDMLLQWRGVFAIDGFQPDYEGSVMRPALRYSEYGSLSPGSRIRLGIGPIFATKGVQGFYYDEDGFEADGGYLGLETRLAIRYPVTPRWQIIGGISGTYLGGSTNRDSTLMASDWDATAFIGVTYAIFQSKTKTFRDN
ncbi:MAG: MipA/OmpV family protein [Mangrovicoccus sp.]